MPSSRPKLLLKWKLCSPIPEDLTALLDPLQIAAGTTIVVPSQESPCRQVAQHIGFQRGGVVYQFPAEWARGKRLLFDDKRHDAESTRSPESGFIDAYVSVHDRLPFRVHLSP